MPIRNSEAPGLKWRKRSDGTSVAYWASGGRTKNFWPRTVRLWSGIAPTAEETAQIHSMCRHWQKQKLESQRPRNRLDPPAGDVYFASANGLIKIGFSRHPRNRMAQLQQGAPYVVTLLGTVPGTLATEKDLHSLFAKERVRNEWFRPSEFLLAYIERECGNKHGPEPQECPPERGNVRQDRTVDATA